MNEFERELSSYELFSHNKVHLAVCWPDTVKGMILPPYAKYL